MYDPIGMLAEGVAYSDCIGLVCGINLATWSLKLPSGLPDSCVPSLPLTSGATASSCVDVRGFDLSGTVTGALGGILLTSATPVGDPTCTQFLGTTPDMVCLPRDNKSNAPNCPTSNCAPLRKDEHWIRKRL